MSIYNYIIGILSVMFHQCVAEVSRMLNCTNAVTRHLGFGRDQFCERGGVHYNSVSTFYMPAQTLKVNRR